MKSSQSVNVSLMSVVLILALWLTGYGIWALGPALGGTPTNLPYMSEMQQARVAICFFICGLTMAFYRKDLFSVIVCSAISSVLFGLLFGAFLFVAPWTTAVPSYFVGMILSLFIFRTGFNSVFRVTRQHDS